MTAIALYVKYFIHEISDTDIDALYLRIGANVKKYRELRGITQL